MDNGMLFASDDCLSEAGQLAVIVGAVHLAAGTQ